MIIIAAHDKNRVIGFQNQLPWHLPEDLKRFRDITMGHALIMGRKTFESIGKPLPGRKNIVVSRDPLRQFESVTMARSLEEALEKVPPNQKAFVIGGSGLFKEAFEKAEEMMLTLIDAEYEGDVYFPAYDINNFEVIDKSENKISPQQNISYSYLTIRRKS